MICKKHDLKNIFISTYNIITKGEIVKDIKLHYVNNMYESKMSKHAPKVYQFKECYQSKKKCKGDF
jgi:hypothetical protein